MSLTLDPARIDQFGASLERHHHRRIPQAVLWREFDTAFPNRPQGRENRAWLLAALRSLEAQGRIEFPSERGRLWDRRAEPALPRQVRRVVIEAPVEWDWRAFPWHPKLLWVTTVGRPTPSQIAFLMRVHEGLVEGWFDKPAPLRHRSLQLTGDEKQLVRLHSTSLFGEDRLSLDLLGCAREPTPLAWERVGDRNTMIVFENAGSFHQAREELANLADAPFGLVAYGGGGTFRRSVRYITTLPFRVERLVYVGDLDRPGIRIAHTSAEAARSTGLPRLEPATVLHEAMLQQAAEFGSPGGWPHQPDLPLRAEWLEWLDPSVRDRAAAIMDVSQRIPEEVLGPDVMREVLSGFSPR